MHKNMHFLFAMFALSLGLQANAFADSVDDYFMSLAGCYQVTIDFREGAPGHDSFNFMKEKVAVTKIGAGYHVKHTTIVDEEARGEDPIIANWNSSSGPTVFEHLTEIWQPNQNGSWKQTTLAPYSHRLVFECDGVWLGNEWSCNIENVGMMRRDRMKNRTDFSTMSISQSIVVSTALPQRYSRILQRNFKRDAQGMLVAVEQGMIQYELLSDERCASANR